MIRSKNTSPTTSMSSEELLESNPNNKKTRKKLRNAKRRTRHYLASCFRGKQELNTVLFHFEKCGSHNTLGIQDDTARMHQLEGADASHIFSLKAMSDQGKVKPSIQSSIIEDKEENYFKTRDCQIIRAPKAEVCRHPSRLFSPSPLLPIEPD